MNRLRVGSRGDSHEVLVELGGIPGGVKVVLEQVDGVGGSHKLAGGVGDAVQKGRTIRGGSEGDVLVVFDLRGATVVDFKVVGGRDPAVSRGIGVFSFELQVPLEGGQIG